MHNETIKMKSIDSREN